MLEKEREIECMIVFTPILTLITSFPNDTLKL